MCFFQFLLLLTSHYNKKQDEATLFCFGLIPEGGYASNNVKSDTNEKTFKSKECNITYVEDSTWGNYVNATIRIENQGSQDIEEWKIFFDYDGSENLYTYDSDGRILSEIKLW
ncbi:MAG: cellulose binding domain-containing protein [Lachnospiraceae bacterium]|nr:cellulose binding domain-containing protein [Lachnospiraceae bacterium]